MNVKFSDDAINLKITEAELEKLCTGQSVATTLAIAGRRLAFRIIPSAGGEEVQCDYTADDETTTLLVTAPAGDIQTLADMGRSKQGINLQASAPQITLQVDIRSDLREKATKRS